MGKPIWDECKQVVGMIEEGLYRPRKERESTFVSYFSIKMYVVGTR